MDASAPQLHQIESPQRLTRCIATPGSYWIWGPPGAGKTTLARSAAHASPHPVAWVRLDAIDRDPPSFFARVRAAVETTQAADLSGLPPCTAAHLAGLGAYSRMFSETLLGASQPAATLVLDGLDAILDAPWIIDTMRYLLEARTSASRILITARTRPPAALSRQRANRTLSQIGPEMLSLTAAEIDTSLERLGTQADAATVEQVLALTRGWAAGVAALSAAMQSGQAIGTKPSRTPEWLIDYFAAEVLGRASEVEHRALLDIAFLPFIDAPVVAALGAPAQVLEVLQRWASQGLFVEQTGASTPARLTLHPLFAAALRARLVAESGADAVRDRQRSTARALAAVDALEQALVLHHAGEEFDEAVRLLDLLAPSMYRGGRFEALKEWSRRLPSERLHAHPRLCYWIGLAELFFDPAAGRPWLIEAIAGCERSGDRDMMLAALGFMIGSYFIEHSSTVPITPWLDQLHARSAAFAALSDPGTRGNVAVAAFSGMLLAAPDHPELPLWEERLHAMLAEPIDALVRMRGALMLAKHYYYTGQYERIGPLRERLESLACDPALPAYAQLAWYLIRLPDCWTRADASAAQRELAAALAKADACGIHALDNHNRLHAVCALLLSGDLSAAERLLRAVQLGTLPAKHMEAWHLHLHRAWHALLRGDRARATAYANACLRDARTLGGVANAMFAHIALAYGAVDPNERRSAVSEIGALAERARSDIGRFHAHVLSAVDCVDQGAMHEAHTAIVAAAMLGTKHGYTHFHFAVPDVLARFCAAALHVDQARSFAQQLIRARKLPPPLGALHDPRWPRPVRVHVLGRFDIFVNDTALTAPARAQRRPVELLQALIAFGADRVPVARLCDALWPELDGDAARQAFKVALHRLRRMLGVPGTIAIQHDLASLDPALVWVDALALNASLARSAPAKGGPGRSTPAPGPLFPGVETAWALGARRELERALAAQSLDHPRSLTH